MAGPDMRTPATAGHGPTEEGRNWGRGFHRLNGGRPASLAVHPTPATSAASTRPGKPAVVNLGLAPQLDAGATQTQQVLADVDQQGTAAIRAAQQPDGATMPTDMSSLPDQKAPTEAQVDDMEAFRVDALSNCKTWVALTSAERFGDYEKQAGDV